MPNVFTRVPDSPVPPPSGFGSAVIPVADAFMIAMFSKPKSGTLRTTWVTPSTYWMTLATFLGAVIIAGLLLSGLIGSVTTISTGRRGDLPALRHRCRSGGGRGELPAPFGLTPASTSPGAVRG